MSTRPYVRLLTGRPGQRVNRVPRMLAVLAVLAWLTQGPVAAQAPLRVTDDSGRVVELAGPAQRIVTLAPNLAEIVFEAGAGARLVAASRYADYPEAVTRLPQMGDAFALNLEAISRIRPDLVLVWQSGTPERQRDALKALAQRQGFAVFESEVRSVDGIASTLERIGILAGTGAVAQQAAAAQRSAWAALQARRQTPGTTQSTGQSTGQVPVVRPVRVFYQVWPQPLMTFNGQHLVSQAIRACGGTMGFDTLMSLTPTVSREAVIAFNPQIILSGDPISTDGDVPQSLQAWTAWPHIDAVARRQLRGADGALLTRMGPRFVGAAQRLCALIDAAR